MSALTDALLVAQRRALQSVEKAYVGGKALAEQDVRALTFDRASALIDALKTGRYDPAEWDVPF
jgi:hypothetical protein